MSTSKPSIFGPPPVDLPTITVTDTTSSNAAENTTTIMSPVLELTPEKDETSIKKDRDKPTDTTKEDEGKFEYQSPYVVGNILCLSCAGGDVKKNTTIKAKITKIFTPYTLSCAMLVLLERPIDGVDQMVLKLFDRRFSEQIRNDYGIAPWTTDDEMNYARYIHDGNGAEFFELLGEEEKTLLKDYNFDDELQIEDLQRELEGYYGVNINALQISDEHEEVGKTQSQRGQFVRLKEKPGSSVWSEAQWETFLQYETSKLYQTEKNAYRRLGDLQGKEIPKVFTHITIKHTSDPDKRQFFDVPGILMEYIDGFELNNLGDNVFPNKWQYIMDEAVRILHCLETRELCNTDLGPTSILVSKDETSKSGYRVAVIDFNCSVIRNADIDELTWRAKCAEVDTENKIGQVMQAWLDEKAKGVYNYKESKLAAKLNDDFKEAGAAIRQLFKVESQKWARLDKRATKFNLSGGLDLQEKIKILSLLETLTYFKEDVLDVRVEEFKKQNLGMSPWQVKGARLPDGVEYKQVPYDWGRPPSFPNILIW